MKADYAEADLAAIGRALDAAREEMRHALGIDPMRSLRAETIRQGQVALVNLRAARAALEEAGA